MGTRAQQASGGAKPPRINDYSKNKTVIPSFDILIKLNDTIASRGATDQILDDFYLYELTKVAQMPMYVHTK